MKTKNGKLTVTKRDAVRLSIALWTYLAEHGECK